MKEQWEWPDIFPESCYADDGSLGESHRIHVPGFACKGSACLKASRYN